MTNLQHQVLLFNFKGNKKPFRDFFIYRVTLKP